MRPDSLKLLKLKKENLMISNQKYSPLIEEALEHLSKQGIESLCPALETLLNELMLIEREQTLQASPYERTDQRKGYANGFLGNWRAKKSKKNGRSLT